MKRKKPLFFFTISQYLRAQNFAHGEVWFSLCFLQEAENEQL